MKILAIEKELETAVWQKPEDLLRDEACHVYELYRSGCIREIYFTEHKSAVLVLEAEDKKAATALLNTLPLVKHGKIQFELMELQPYTGYERIMK